MLNTNHFPRFKKKNFFLKKISSKNNKDEAQNKNKGIMLSIKTPYKPK